MGRIRMSVVFSCLPRMRNRVLVVLDGRRLLMEVGVGTGKGKVGIWMMRRRRGWRRKNRGGRAGWMILSFVENTAGGMTLKMEKQTV